MLASLCHTAIGDLISRRSVLQGAAAALAYGLMGRGAAAEKAAGKVAAGGSTLTFREVSHGDDPHAHAAAGYDAQVLLRRGDPVLSDTPAFDPAAQSAASQSRQFGYNCDYTAVLPLPPGNDGASRALLCVNHEYTDTNLMFPGIENGDDLASLSKERVDIDMAAMGHSVVEIQQRGGRWQVVPRGRLNHRITAVRTEMTVSGPAAGIAGALALPVIYVEVPDNLLNEIHLPTWATLWDAPWSGILQAAIVVAVVASAETLLCATAVDRLQQGLRTKTKYDKELRAQGIGNTICGLLGALPMTGVIVRSSANIQSGSRTRLSAILHGLWLLIFVVFLGFLLRLIPASALAAILVYTGYKLMDVKSIKALRKYGWSEVGIYAATVTTIVVADLLMGVLVGMGLAAIKLLYTFSHLVAELKIEEDGDRAHLDLNGTATFIGLPKLAAVLERVPDSIELHVDFQHLDYIDHACLELLMSWASQHESTGGSLVIDWESLHARFDVERNARRFANGAVESPAADSEAAAGERHSTPW